MADLINADDELIPINVIFTLCFRLHDRLIYSLRREGRDILQFSFKKFLFGHDNSATGTTIKGASAALFLALCLPVAAQEKDPVITYGKALVEANCAGCHGVAIEDVSPHAEAPPFRTLWERYPIDALEESFVEGIATGHPDMPVFTATPPQMAAILDYIASLQP